MGRVKRTESVKGFWEMEGLRRPMILALIGLLLALPVGAQSAAPTLSALRHLYAAAATDEAPARRLLAAVNGYDGPSAPILGYRAVAEAVQARYAWSPLTKLRAVREAERLFARAVLLDPQNVEVRFLRFTIEVNVPRYLGYSQHLPDDRAVIMRGAHHYPNLGLDAQSLTLIRDFMLQRGACTPEEARMLRAIVP